jgi:hypothetical protein
MGRQGRVADEAYHKIRKLAVDQSLPDCNEHESWQALPSAVLSIAARQAQSHDLAFTFLISFRVS